MISQASLFSVVVGRWEKILPQVRRSAPLLHSEQPMREKGKEGRKEKKKGGKKKL